MTTTDPSGRADANLSGPERVHRRHLDVEGGSVCETVVSAVAELLEKDQLDVEPLNSVVDPDALDALFEVRMSGEGRDGGEGRVSFTLDGCGVTVYGDEQVVVSR